MTERAKRILKLAAASVPVAAILIAVLTLPPAEPTYDGKKLNYWLPRVHNQALPEEKRLEVSRALTTIGTNNLKLMLEWFREPDQPYKDPWYRRLIEWTNGKLRIIRFSHPRSVEFQPSHPEMAFWLFNEYPSVAACAIPAFTKMFSDTNDTVKGRAALILGRVGKDALSALSAQLTSDNATNRCLAAFAVGNAGADAVPLIPKLEPLLEDKFPYARLASAEALRKLNVAPQMFVPALLDCLRNGDSETKEAALDTISRTTNAAPLAVPALLEILATSTNREDRANIYGVLNSLDPNAANTVRTNIFPASLENIRIPLRLSAVARRPLP